jgi:hypothetical protein
MARINENTLATNVARRVKSRLGRRHLDLPIAQVKDYIRDAFDLVALCKPSEVMELMERHGLGEKGAKR